MSKYGVLFVCNANRCRSPLAAALLERLMAQHSPAGIGLRIESAGLHALQDYPATPLTLQVARNAELELDTHRSRSIEWVEIGDYETVLTMTEIQADALRGAYPIYAGRIHQVSELVNLRADIDDPTGAGLWEHQATLALLERYLKAGLPRLAQWMALTMP